MFSMPLFRFLQVGMSGDAHVLLRCRRVLFLVLLQCGPILLLSLRLHLVTAESVDTMRLSDIAR